MEPWQVSWECQALSTYEVAVVTEVKASHVIKGQMYISNFKLGGKYFQLPGGKVPHGGNLCLATTQN